MNTIADLPLEVLVARVVELSKEIDVELLKLPQGIPPEELKRRLSEFDTEAHAADIASLPRILADETLTKAERIKEFNEAYQRIMDRSKKLSEL